MLAADIEDAKVRAAIPLIFGDDSDPIEEVEHRASQLLKGYAWILWQGDPATFQFNYVSSTAESILGYPVERWLNEPTFWADTIIHPDDKSDAVAYCALATGRGKDHEFQYRAVAASQKVLKLHDIVKVTLGNRKVATNLRGIMIVVPE